jgi:hypothetical protein
MKINALVTNRDYISIFIILNNLGHFKNFLKRILTETETDFGLFLNNLIYAFLLSTIITKKQSFVVHNLGGKRISYNNNIEKLRTFVLRIDLTVFLTGTCKDNLNNTKILFFLYFIFL